MSKQYDNLLQKTIDERAKTPITSSTQEDAKQLILQARQVLNSKNSKNESNKSNDKGNGISGYMKYAAAGGLAAGGLAAIASIPVNPELTPIQKEAVKLRGNQLAGYKYDVISNNLKNIVDKTDLSKLKEKGFSKEDILDYIGNDKDLEEIYNTLYSKNTSSRVNAGIMEVLKKYKNASDKERNTYKALSETNKDVEDFTKRIGIRFSDPQEFFNIQNGTKDEFGNTLLDDHPEFQLREGDIIKQGPVGGEEALMESTGEMWFHAMVVGRNLNGELVAFKLTNTELSREDEVYVAGNLDYDQYDAYRKAETNQNVKKWLTDKAAKSGNKFESQLYDQLQTKEGVKEINDRYLLSTGSDTKYVSKDKYEELKQKAYARAQLDFKYARTSDDRLFNESLDMLQVNLNDIQKKLIKAEVEAKTQEWQDSILKHSLWDQGYQKARANSAVFSNANIAAAMRDTSKAQELIEDSKKDGFALLTEKDLPGHEKWNLEGKRTFVNEQDKKDFIYKATAEAVAKHEKLATASNMFKEEISWDSVKALTPEIKDVEKRGFRYTRSVGTNIRPTDDTASYKTLQEVGLDANRWGIRTQVMRVKGATDEERVAASEAIKALMKTNTLQGFGDVAETLIKRRFGNEVAENIKNGKTFVGSAADNAVVCSIAVAKGWEQAGFNIVGGRDPTEAIAFDMREGDALEHIGTFATTDDPEGMSYHTDQQYFINDQRAKTDAMYNALNDSKLQDKLDKKITLHKRDRSDKIIRWVTTPREYIEHQKQRESKGQRFNVEWGHKLWKDGKSRYTAHDTIENISYWDTQVDEPNDARIMNFLGIKWKSYNPKKDSDPKPTKTFRRNRMTRSLISSIKGAKYMRQ